MTCYNLIAQSSTEHHVFSQEWESQVIFKCREPLS